MKKVLTFILFFGIIVISTWVTAMIIPRDGIIAGAYIYLGTILAILIMHWRHNED